MSNDNYWLVRPGTIRRLLLILVICLVLTLVPDLFIHRHEYFRIDSSFGFFAWYGFFTCVTMVVLAKILGLFIKRKDSYYDD